MSFAVSLSVSVHSLDRLGIGHDGEAWCFPMRAAGRVCGIRRRLLSGRKLSVRGGHEGLFVPFDLRREGPLLIAEGPTDTAALLDLGFNCVGRPSCTGGTKLLFGVAHARDAVIVSDGDEPGRRGAASLACALVAYCRSVRIIRPPDGVKDARAWKQAGGTRQDIQAAIAAAEPIRLRIARVSA